LIYRNVMLRGSSSRTATESRRTIHSGLIRPTGPDRTKEASMHHIVRAALIALAVAFAASASPTAPILVAAAQAQAPLLDINSATKKQLVDALKGVGDATADKLIKSRPYKRKDELVSKGVLTQSVYDGIKDQIIAKQ
jgi:DNA uptake protein ComE-like DNA-binding protein